MRVRSRAIAKQAFCTCVWHVRGDDDEGFAGPCTAVQMEIEIHKTTVRQRERQKRGSQTETRADAGSWIDWGDRMSRQARNRLNRRRETTR